jgi:hypothetical protein
MVRKIVQAGTIPARDSNVTNRCTIVEINRNFKFFDMLDRCRLRYYRGDMADIA